MKLKREMLLKLLKDELQFVENGGYRTAEGASWRSAYIFEESPSCPNFTDRSRPHSCQDCWLMEFVSSDLREEQVPCRFVQLTPDGATVDSLYRCGTYAETEEALKKWLHERIRELESQIAEGVRFPFTVKN